MFVSRRERRQRRPLVRGSLFGRTRAGLTMLELLVILTVIGLLLGLLIPAVTAMRESSRRAQCQQNLRNYAAALLNFEGVHRKLPAGIQASPNFMVNGKPALGSRASWSAHTHLLPYLDQMTVYQQIEFEEAPENFVDSPIENQLPLLQTVVPVFLCPSDGGDHGTNYRVSLGTEAFPYPSETDPLRGTGPFSGLEGFRLSEITDGLSQTAAASEAIKSPKAPHPFGRADYWYSSLGTIVRGPSTVQVLNACRALRGPPTYYYPYVGHSWAIGGYAYTWYNHATTPNSETPNCTQDGWYDYVRLANARSLYGVHQASSEHSGGVNVVMLDGSVRFASDEIDDGVWRAIGTRAGKESARF